MAEHDPGSKPANMEDFNRGKRLKELSKLWNKAVESEDINAQVQAMLNWLKAVSDDVANFTDKQTEIRSGYVDMVARRSEQMKDIYQRFANTTQGQPNHQSVLDQLNAALYRVKTSAGSRLIEWMV